MQTKKLMGDIREGARGPETLRDRCQYACDVLYINGGLTLAELGMVTRRLKNAMAAPADA